MTRLSGVNEKRLRLSQSVMRHHPLCDMDAELAAVQARRNKTRALKQGMTQALLTGRVRLAWG